MSGFQVEFNRANFQAFVGMVRSAKDNLLPSVLGASGMGGAEGFVRKSQVYLATQMQRALDDGGQGGVVRGAYWAPFAQHSVTRPRYNNESAIVGTLGYQRKYARGVTTKKQGATWSASQRKSAYAASDLVRTRPFEYVYARRASGARYSASSKLMLDTGRMRAGLILMDTTVNGNAIELRPGANVDYFAHQNQMRPIWFIQNDVDEPVLQRYLQQSVDEFTGAFWSGS